MTTKVHGFLIEDGAITSEKIEDSAILNGHLVSGEIIYNLRDTGPAGGLIFYDKGFESDGWRYLEAAPNDQSIIQWYNGSYDETSAIATSIGTGITNTPLIVSIQGAGSYAAQLCDDLIIDIYDDWFLPSKYELNYMYTELHYNGVGGFADNGYWSSSELNDDIAWFQNFGDGNQLNFYKYSTYWVRAVRAF